VPFIVFAGEWRQNTVRIIPAQPAM